MKTAALLLNEFSSLENILTNTEDIKKTSVREAIAGSAERLRRNYKIIKLDNAVAMPFALQELEYDYAGITTTEVLKGIGLK